MNEWLKLSTLKNSSIVCFLFKMIYDFININISKLGLFY